MSHNPSELKQQIDSLRAEVAEARAALRALEAEQDAHCHSIDILFSVVNHPDNKLIVPDDDGLEGTLGA